MNKKFLLSFILTSGIITCTQASEYIECGKTTGDITTGDNANCWSCGESCSARLDSDGNMTISGSGKMNDYATKDDLSYSSVPWFNQRNEIKSVTIDSGITSVGNEAFQGSSNLSSVNLSDTVESVGYDTFAYCPLKELELPSSVKKLGSFSFGSGSYSKVVIPASVLSLGTVSLSNSIKELVFEGNIPSVASGWLRDNDNDLVITYNGGDEDKDKLVEALKIADIDWSIWNKTHDGQKATTQLSGVILKGMNADGTYSLYNGDDGKYIETYNANGTVYTPSSYTVKTATERVNRIGGCEDVKCSLKMWFK